MERGAAIKCSYFYLYRLFMFNLFKKKKKISKAGNAVNQIQVYWNGITWVFDDARVGLVEEPFVAGADRFISEAIDELHDFALDNAKKNGVLITFSSTEFPAIPWEARVVLTSEFKKLGEGMYMTGTGESGWLCPATLHYFEDYPKEIFSL